MVYFPVAQPEKERRIRLVINFRLTTNLQLNIFEKTWATIWKIAKRESIIIESSWKHWGKMRTCSSWAISPFATIFSHKSYAADSPEFFGKWERIKWSMPQQIWIVKSKQMKGYLLNSKIAHHEKFLVLEQRFHKSSAITASKCLKRSVPIGHKCTSYMLSWTRRQTGNTTPLHSH